MGRATYFKVAYALHKWRSNVADGRENFSIASTTAGINARNTYSAHAEETLLSRYYRKIRNKKRVRSVRTRRGLRVTIVNIRVGWGSSQPCLNCSRMLMTSLVRRVYFTDGINDELSVLSRSQLMDAEPQISRGNRCHHSATDECGDEEAIDEFKCSLIIKYNI